MLAGPQPGPPASTSPSRKVPLFWFGMALAVAVALALVLAGTLLVLRPPTSSSSGPLLWAQAQTVNTLYQAEFVVPSEPGAGGAAQILIVAMVNVSCGGPSYLSGTDYVCELSLVSGTTGGNTEDLLWNLTFNGHVVTNTTELAPGLYTLLIHVVIGSPPALVAATDFNTILSVTATY